MRIVIYAVIGAVVVGLSLGLLGSGGSILTVPVLRYLLNHEAKVAIAESLGIVGAIALASTIPYARSRLVDWRIAFLFGVPGMVGTYGGAWIASFVSPGIQLLVFACVMMAAAVLMWRDRSSAGSLSSRSQPIGMIGLQGVSIGLLTGFVGVGGGFVIVPALVLLGGLSMRAAVGTSLTIIALNSATGFWKYLDVLGDLDLHIDWKTMVAFVLLGILGSIAGKDLNARIDQARLKRGFAVFLVGMGVLIFVKESAGLST